MNALGSLRIAVRAIRQNALRSALTVLGIMIGVAAVIVMVAVGAGSQQHVERQIESLGSNLLMVTPGSVSIGGVSLGAGSSTTLTEDDAAAINRDVDSLAAAGVVWWSGGQSVHGSRNWNSRIHGVDPAYLVARNRTVTHGRPLRQEDVDRAAKVAFLGQTVVKQLFGNEDPVGKVIRLRNVPFVVAGVLDLKGQAVTGRNEDNIIYVPISAARVSFARTLAVRPSAVSAISGTARFAAPGDSGGGSILTSPPQQTTLKEIRAGSVSAIYIKARDAESVPLVERDVVALLRQRHGLSAGTPNDFHIRDLTVVARARKESTDILATMLTAIAAISLLVGGIGIMNIMLVSVTERHREIGIRMAIGARRSDVLRQFLIEAVTLSLAGGVAGIALGMAGTSVVGRLIGLTLAVDPLSILVALGFACAVGVVFGYYPAHRASRLDPVVVLRRE